MQSKKRLRLFLISYCRCRATPKRSFDEYFFMSAFFFCFLLKFLNFKWLFRPRPLFCALSRSPPVRSAYFYFFSLSKKKNTSKFQNETNENKKFQQLIYYFFFYSTHMTPSKYTSTKHVGQEKPSKSIWIVVVFVFFF